MADVTNSTIVLRNTASLKPHEMSLRTYGHDECIDDLLPSIREHGILNPLAVSDDGVILSGCRRWKTACELGLEQVPCISVNPGSQELETLFIVESNRSRVKTPEQLYREGAAIRDALKVLSRKKMLSGLKFHCKDYRNEGCIALVGTTKAIGAPNDANISNTRATVADILKMKESTWRRLSFIGDAAVAGNELANSLLQELSNDAISFTGAERKLRAALRKEAAEEAGHEPEQELSRQDILTLEGRKHARALSRILRSAAELPDDEFQTVKWMLLRVFLQDVAAASDRLEVKVQNKFKSTLQAIHDDPAQREAFMRGDFAPRKDVTAA